MVGFDGADAADAGSHRYAIAMRVGLLHFETRIAQSLHAGRDAVVHEGIALASLFGLEVLRNVEILDRAGEARRERADIEVFDRADAADAVADILPPLGN